MNPRAEIFEAVKRQVPAVWNDAGNILAMDNLLDALGVPRDGAQPGTGRRFINAAGLDLIKRFEGLRLTAYKDMVGVWTIGYGSTGLHVQPGMTITEDQAEGLLRSDLRRFEDAVAEFARVATDNQFAAMVSLAFNVGEGDGGLKTSTLLRKHNEGDYAGARAEFARWNRAGGRVVSGLVKRRAAEAELYGRTA